MPGGVKNQVNIMPLVCDGAMEPLWFHYNWGEGLYGRLPREVMLELKVDKILRIYLKQRNKQARQSKEVEVPIVLLAGEGFMQENGRR